jgi:F420-dependent oxidoreductase-like protein
MADATVAIHVPITTVPETVATVQQAERAGVPAVWFTSGGFGPDSLTTVAVIGAATERILIGTSVVVTYSRHPLVMAQQSLAIDDVAPGRFRLGIGTGHRPTIEEVYGLPFDRPLEQLREYAEVLTQALGGEVSHVGRRLRVQGRLARAHSVPVYFSALRVAAYRLAGELAAGAISWVTPLAYLRDVAGPTLRDAARDHGRPAPRLVGHLMGLVTDDPGAAIEHGRQRLAANTRQVFYQRLFADAGHPDARDGTVPKSLVDEVVAVGDEGQVARRLRSFVEAGCDEVIVSILPGTPGEFERTVRLVGRWAEVVS